MMANETIIRNNTTKIIKLLDFKLYYKAVVSKTAGTSTKADM